MKKLAIIVFAVFIGQSAMGMDIVKKCLSSEFVEEYKLLYNHNTKAFTGKVLSDGGVLTAGGFGINSICRSFTNPKTRNRTMARNTIGIFSGVCTALLGKYLQYN